MCVCVGGGGVSSAEKTGGVLARSDMPGDVGWVGGKGRGAGIRQNCAELYTVSDDSRLTV